MNQTLTKHHLIPTSRFGVNSKDNIRMIRENKHRAFHLIFDNRMPHEQLEWILAFNSPVLTRDVQHAVQNVLVEHDGYIYRNGVLRKIP